MHDRRCSSATGSSSDACERSTSESTTLSSGQVTTCHERVPALPGAAVAAQEPRASVRGVRCGCAASGPSCGSYSRARATSERCRTGVEARGRVSSDELVDLYRRAAALVFPSLYEGFGMPVVEAMACGCPVACSNDDVAAGGRRRRGAPLRSARSRRHRRGRRRGARRPAAVDRARPRRGRRTSRGTRALAPTTRSTASSPRG